MQKPKKNIKKKKLLKLSFRLENKESFEKEAKSFELKNVNQVVFLIRFVLTSLSIENPLKQEEKASGVATVKKAKIHHMVKSFKYLLSIKNMLKILNPYFKTLIS